MKREHKNKTVPLISSGVAEYLTFVATTRYNGMHVIYADEKVCLSKEVMAS